MSNSPTSASRLRSVILDLFAIPFLLVAALFLTVAIFEGHKGQWLMAAFLFIFGAVPGTTGLLLLWVGASQPQDPASHTAWMNRSDWRSGRISFSDGRQALIQWAFWTLFSGPVAMFCYFLIPMLIRDRSYVPLTVIAVFPIVSIVLLVKALSQTRHWIAFGESVFRMNSVPFSPGSTLSGSIQLRRQFVADSEFQLRLTCAEHWMIGGAKSGRTYEKVLWSAEQLSPSDGQSIPVSFAIPKDGIPTGQMHGGRRVWWQLSATVQSNRQKYYSRFEVPVFAQDAAGEQVPDRLTLSQLA